MLQNIDVASAHTQAIVVSPTRELSQQIAFVVQSLSEYMNVKVHASVGGTDSRQDAKLLQ